MNSPQHFLCESSSPIKLEEPSREDALAISKRELTSDEVRNVLMSLSCMRGIKCGKSQLSRDKATVGLINWGGMWAHCREERSFIWYMF